MTHSLSKMKRQKKIDPLYCNQKKMSVLYWLCKEEVTHSKLNSLLQLHEFLWEEEVTTFKRRLIRVLRELLSIVGSQVKGNLIKRIKKFPFFGTLTDDVTFN